ncbi:MAG TPA: hypothetical protein VL172_02675 [Kofleriaceae bacterium]|nr:hypothetical protein [Kofleriaceae bacterium]
MRWLASLLLMGALGGCGDAASSGDCDKLLDHMIKLETRATGADKLEGEMAKDLDSQQKELKESLKKEFMEQCKERTPGSYVQCALGKKSVEELDTCGK